MNQKRSRLLYVHCIKKEGNMSKKIVYLLPIIYILLFLAVPQEAQSQSLELIPAERYIQ